MLQSYKFIFILFSFLWIYLCSNTALAQNPIVTKLLSQGEPSPTGGLLGPINFFSLNDKEDIVFNNYQAEFLKTSIFLSSGHTTTSIVADSQVVEGLGMFSRLTTSSLNNQGSIAFDAQLTNAQSDQRGLFLRTAQGAITQIVLHGSPTEGGTLETPVLYPFSLNNSGSVAFSAYITPEPFRQAIFISNGTTISKAIATGDAAPIGGTFSFAFLTFRGFNDQGIVLFTDKIDNGSSKEGLFTSSGGTISKVASEGETAPDGNPFFFFGGAAINNLGDVVFQATVCDTMTDECYDGLFLYSNGSISTIIKQGDPSPVGGIYSGFSTPQINDERHIIFQVSLLEGTYTGGIFRAVGGAIEKLVLYGETTPIGGSFSGFNAVQLNAAGTVAFSAYLTGSNTSTGIFLWNGAPRLDVSRDTVEFTDIIPGQTSKLEMAVSNSGGKPLVVQEITVAPGPPFGLENLPTLPLTLQPGQSTQFLVTYLFPSGSSQNLKKDLDALQDGSLNIKAVAPNPSAIIPLVVQRNTNLKVDILPSEGTEVKAGQAATIEIKVVDQSNNVLTEFDGGATIKLLEDQSTPGITRLPAFQSVSISNGVAQSIFFFTPKEPFALEKPIDQNTVLSGKAVIEVQLENSNIPAVKKEINVKSPLDFFIDSIDVQQGVIKTDKDVFQEYLPGLQRTFPALPFIAEHNTAVQVFVSYRNTTAIPFSKIELPGISAELQLLHNDNLILTVANMKSGGNSTRDFILKDVYTQIEKESLRDALFELLTFNNVKSPGTYSFRAELKPGTKLDEVEAEKENNKKTYIASFIETKPLRVLASVSARSGQNTTKVEGDVWDLLKDIYPIQNSKLIANDPNSRTHYFSGGLIFSDIKFKTLTGILNRFNKENPNDQRDVLIMFSPPDIAQEICSNQNSGGCAESVGGKVCILGYTSALKNAHEVGHLLGLRDTYKTDRYSTNDGEPNPRRSSATNDGNPVESGNIHLSNREKTLSELPHFDFMGTGSWIDRVSWNYLYQTKFQLGSGAMLAANNPELDNGFIAVSGTIDTNGTATFNPFLTLSQVPEIDQSQDGDYSFEFQNNSGTPISTHSFDVEFNIPDAGDQAEVPFSFYLPLPEETTKLVMKKNNVEIASRNFSANPPNVQIISPQSGETIFGTKTIQWTSSDIDGDNLTYDIIYSSDGQNQQVLAVNIPDTSFEWNSAQVPYSTSSSITVISNDGINESRSVVENLLIDSPTDVERKEELIPKEFTLRQNYPNPFNPSTTISFDLPIASDVSIIVYDVQGQEVNILTDKRYSAGQFSLEWNGKDNLGREVSSGVYFIQMRAEEYRVVRKAILLK